MTAVPWRRPPADGPACFAIVGAGWRAEFLLRIAAAAPEWFTVTGVVARTASRREYLATHWKVPVHSTLEDALAARRPDFVVVAVSWDATPECTEAVVRQGIPVLAETPPAPDVPGLRALWQKVGDSGLVQVAEQYTRMPGHAARLAAIRAGFIGEPTSADISSTHLYHAVSLLRHYLDVGFTLPVVRATAVTAPLADPLTKDGWRGDATPQPATTTYAWLDFGGRFATYTFTDNQWWNPLRARRIIVRGSLGEWVDDTVVRLVDPFTPVQSVLLRRRVGVDLNLEGVDLDHISLDGQVMYRNRFFGARLSEDDVAVADILADMAAWVRESGPPPYPLAEACQDHLIACAIDDAVKSQQPVLVSPAPWSHAPRPAAT